jgi:glutathione S-transferase
MSDAPRITLYGPKSIPYVLKVQGALALKGLDHTLVEPQGEEDYRRWSPETGQLPVIDLGDGEHIPDSGRILDVLDERFPTPPLLAPDPKVARSQRRLEQWVEAAFMFYWLHYLRELVGADESQLADKGGLGDEFEERLDDLVNFLGGRPYFYADAPSRADFAVWGFLSGIRVAVSPAVDARVKARGPLQAHLERMQKWAPAET